MEFRWKVNRSKFTNIEKESVYLNKQRKITSADTTPTLKI